MNLCACRTYLFVLFMCFPAASLSNMEPLLQERWDLWEMTSPLIQHFVCVCALGVFFLNVIICLSDCPLTPPLTWKVLLKEWQWTSGVTNHCSSVVWQTRTCQVSPYLLASNLKMFWLRNGWALYHITWDVLIILLWSSNLKFLSINKNYDIFS